jgi:hypothetical protein
MLRFCPFDLTFSLPLNYVFKLLEYQGDLLGTLISTLHLLVFGDGIECWCFTRVDLHALFNISPQ